MMGFLDVGDGWMLEVSRGRRAGKASGDVRQILRDRRGGIARPWQAPVTGSRAGPTGLRVGSGKLKKDEGANPEGKKLRW
jgi:hypothetical protein